MKNKTAVEWLIEQWPILETQIPERILEAAKELEKQQIINSFWHGDNSDCTSEQNSNEFAEKYYNLTYGGENNEQ